MKTKRIDKGKRKKEYYKEEVRGFWVRISLGEYILLNRNEAEV